MPGKVQLPEQYACWQPEIGAANAAVAALQWLSVKLPQPMRRNLRLKAALATTSTMASHWPPREVCVKREDWILVSAWLIYVAMLGPYLISARSNLLVGTGIAVLVGLLYFTQRRVIPIVKEKMK